MDFVALLIIGLWIIFTTWKMKIEKKWGVIFIFLIYLIFLLHTGYLEWNILYKYNETFTYSYNFMWFGANDLFLGIFYIEFFFIFYFLFYYLIFPFQDKKINLKKKLYFLWRDFIILFSVFCFFWGYNDVVWKYMKYHDWYLSEKNFWWEEFICLDNSVTLLLEHNYRHEVIVNPYKNFFEFYKNYWKPQKTWIILTNKLPEFLTHEDFLLTCKNKNLENYYEKYINIHGSEPYFKQKKSDYYTEVYSLSNEEQSNIITSLRKINSTALKYRKQTKKTILTEIKGIETNFEIYTDILGSWYCRGWKLILKNKLNTFILFEHDEYCIVGIKLKENNLLNIALNYWDGGWSWEWFYIDMLYDIENKTWEFLNTWKNHSHDWYGNQEKFSINWNIVVLSDYEYIDDRLDSVYKYFNDNYNVK